MGSINAERIIAADHPVTMVTPGNSVSSWPEMTSEAKRVRKHLMKIGVEIVAPIVFHILMAKKQFSPANFRTVN